MKKILIRIMDKNTIKNAEARIEFDFNDLKYKCINDVRRTFERLMKLQNSTKTLKQRVKESERSNVRSLKSKHKRRKIEKKIVGSTT